MNTYIKTKSKKTKRIGVSVFACEKSFVWIHLEDNQRANGASCVANVPKHESEAGVVEHVINLPNTF